MRPSKNLIEKFVSHYEATHLFMKQLVKEKVKLNLEFFVGYGFSLHRIKGYKYLEILKERHAQSKKFSEPTLLEALEIVFEEFELYANVDVSWIERAVQQKFLGKKYDRMMDNKLYGAFAYALVKNGASQNNAIQFVSAVSGKALTVIRDSMYETKFMREKLGNFTLGSMQFHGMKLQYFLNTHKETIERFANQPRFSKSKEALTKLMYFLNQAHTAPANGLNNLVLLGNIKTPRFN